MIVPIKQWTLVRPMVVASRARRVQKSQVEAPKKEKSKEGFLDFYAKMWEYQVDLAIRNMKDE